MGSRVAWKQVIGKRAELVDRNTLLIMLTFYHHACCFALAMFCTIAFCILPPRVARHNAMETTPALNEPIVIFQEKWARLVLDGVKTMEVRHQPLGKGLFWIGITKPNAKKQRKKPLVVGRFEVVGQQLLTSDSAWLELQQRHCCESVKRPYATTWCVEIGQVERCQPVPFVWMPGVVNRTKFRPVVPHANPPSGAEKKTEKRRSRRKSALTPWPKQRCKKVQPSRLDSGLQWKPSLACPIGRTKRPSKKRLRSHLWGDDRPAKAAAQDPGRATGSRQSRNVVAAGRIAAGRTSQQLANLMAFRPYQEHSAPKLGLMPKAGVFGKLHGEDVLILDHFKFRGRDRCDVVPLEMQCGGQLLAQPDQVATVWASDVVGLHTDFVSVPRKRRACRYDAESKVHQTYRAHVATVRTQVLHQHTFCCAVLMLFDAIRRPCHHIHSAFYLLLGRCFGIIWVTFGAVHRLCT